MFEKRNRGARKLSGVQVSDIRRRYEGGATQSSLSREYQVSVGQIGRIVRGESWQGGTGYTPPAAPIEMDVAEMDARILALQRAHSVQTSTSPPSLLDGGNAADETQGAGINVLEARARDLGVK